MLNDILDKGLIMEVDELTSKLIMKVKNIKFGWVIDGIHTVIFIQLVVSSLKETRNSDRASAQCADYITCI